MARVYAGTSGWSYPTWKPDFYPAKLASAKFLQHYATRLNTVEVNYTFRHFASDAFAGAVMGWYIGALIQRRHRCFASANFQATL